MYRSNFKYKPKQKIYNSDSYACFDPHSTPGYNPVSKNFLKTIDSFSSNYLGITSIDPGIVNLGLYIGFFWDNGTVSSHTLETLNFAEADRSGEKISIQKYDQAIEMLDEYLPIIENTHYVVIESQLTTNPDAVRMLQHLITYFTLRLKDKGCKPIIIEFSSLLKTKSLGGPVGKKKGQTADKAKKERKEWCRAKAQEIFETLGDPFLERVVKKRAKRGEGKSKYDDKGDVVCQFWAFLLECMELEWWPIFFPKKFNFRELLNFPLKE